MPNLENIHSPLTMVGNGRSGTSLMSRVLGEHPQCKLVGETVDLIHSVTKSMESSLAENKKREIPELIRYQFLQLFPSSERYWMHKPIGVPFVWRFFPAEEEFADWFWEVFEKTFLRAKFFTVLRHPLDIAVSSQRWWNRSYDEIINTNRIIAQLICHPRSQVHYAVNYHQVIEQPKDEVLKLFDYLGIEFDEQCMNAFRVKHVLNEQDVRAKKSWWPRAKLNSPVLQARRAAKFTHRENWKEIDAALLTPAYRTAVEQCWAKFNQDFCGWHPCE